MIPPYLNPELHLNYLTDSLFFLLLTIPPSSVDTILVIKCSIWNNSKHLLKPCNKQPKDFDETHADDSNTTRRHTFSFLHPDLKFLHLGSACKHQLIATDNTLHISEFRHTRQVNDLTRTEGYQLHSYLQKPYQNSIRDRSREEKSNKQTPNLFPLIVH